MRAKYVVLIILIPALGPVSGQTRYSMKKELSASEKDSLFQYTKEVFNLDATFSFNITTKTVQATFEEMNEEQDYDDQYLTKAKMNLDREPNNPIYLNNLASYYNHVGKTEKATNYFQRAYDNLEVHYFNHDTGRYLSFRAFLKLNLGMEGAESDLDSALIINPNDSLAIVSYPLFLLNKGEFDKAKDICVDALNSGKTDQFIPYIYLIMGEIYDRFTSASIEIENPEIKAQLVEQEIEDLMDFHYLDKFARKYKNNIHITNAREIAEMMAYFFKVLIFETDDNNNPQLAFTEKDKENINELINWVKKSEKKGTLNPYSVQYCLGFLNLYLENLDKSRAHFKNAIKVFPSDKKDQYFSATDSYVALIGIAYMKEDTANYRKAVLQKINDQPSGHIQIKDLELMAVYHYLHGNNNKVLKWCKKIKEVDPENFTMLRLMMQMKFEEGDRLLAEFLGKDAEKQIKDHYDKYNLLIQYAVLFLHNGNAPDQVKEILDMARLSMKEVGDTCEICDELENKYLVKN